MRKKIFFLQKTFLSFSLSLSHLSKLTVRPRASVAVLNRRVLSRRDGVRLLLLLLLLLLMVALLLLVVVVTLLLLLLLLLLRMKVQRRGGGRGGRRLEGGRRRAAARRPVASISSSAGILDDASAVAARDLGLGTKRFGKRKNKKKKRRGGEGELSDSEVPTAVRFFLLLLSSSIK